MDRDKNNSKQSTCLLHCTLALIGVAIHQLVCCCLIFSCTGVFLLWLWEVKMVEFNTTEFNAAATCKLRQSRQQSHTLGWSVSGMITVWQHFCPKWMQLQHSFNSCFFASAMWLLWDWKACAWWHCFASDKRVAWGLNKFLVRPFWFCQKKNFRRADDGFAMNEILESEKSYWVTL